MFLCTQSLCKTISHYIQFHYLFWIKYIISATAHELEPLVNDVEEKVVHHEKWVSFYVMNINCLGLSHAPQIYSFNLSFYSYSWGPDIINDNSFFLSIADVNLKIRKIVQIEKNMVLNQITLIKLTIKL